MSQVFNYLNTEYVEEPIDSDEDSDTEIDE